ncbi:hypothetical protein INT47_006178, partial [Mucor saturninus]
MFSRLTLLVMACSTSQALYLEKRQEPAEDKTTTANHSATEASTKKEITTTTSKKPEPTTTTTTNNPFNNHESSTRASSTHASSTHASSTKASTYVSSKASSSSIHTSATQTTGTTSVIPLLPTLTPSSTSTALPEQVSPGSSSSSALSGGAIGGIVAAVIVLIIAGSAFMLVRRKKERHRLRAERNRADPFTMGFGSDDPKPFEHYEVTPIPDEEYSKQHYEPQLSPPPHTNSPTATAATATATATATAIGAGAMTTIATATTTPTSPSTKTELPVNAVTAATLLASPVSAVASPIPTIIEPVQEEHAMGSFTVIATYIPTLTDELEIQAGDQINLIVEYDDGWCQGINLSRGHTKGVFPRHCIDYATAPSDHHVPNFEPEKSKRVSSMYV